MDKEIKIVVTDKKNKRQIEIPLTYKQCSDILDFGFMINEEDEFYETLKLNKCDESFWDLHKTMGQINDAIDEGRCYQLGENGNIILSDTISFLQGEPKWTEISKSQ